MGPGWNMKAEDVIGLPVDELALAVLRDFDAGGGWNAYNWTLEADQRYPGRKDVSAAFSEAWSWLLSRGLVARDFRNSSAEAVFVTRAGRRSIDEGLAEVRAIERLQVELHPALESKVRHVYLVGITRQPSSRRSRRWRSECARPSRRRTRCSARS